MYEFARLSLGSRSRKGRVEGALYNNFIAEASLLFVQALTNKTDDIAGLARIYAMVGSMRQVSDQTGIDAAMRVERNIIET